MAVQASQAPSVPQAQQTQYIRVKNETGAKIMQGAVTHATESYGIQTVPLNGLDDGHYSDVVAMYTGPSSRDYWWVCWTNDGKNYVAYSNRSAIHDHENPNTPGTVILRGQLGNDALAVWFVTDGDSTDKDPILNPW